MLEPSRLLYLNCLRARRWLARCCFALLLALAAVPVVAGLLTASAAPLGQASTPRGTLTVVIDDNYPPYVFRDAADGQIKGYLVDLWALWQQQTGVPVKLDATDWKVAQQRMAAHQAEVIDTIFKTAERERRYSFGAPYADVPVAIYAHAGIGGITDLASLRGFLVGVKAGDACVDSLNRAGVSNLSEFTNYESLVNAAVQEQVRIFCLDEPPANYLLYKAGAVPQFNRSFRLETGQFHRAVHLGQEATLQLVEQGFAAISAAQRQALQDKWMGQSFPVLTYSRWWSIALLVALAGAGLLLLWVATLKRVVHTRTAELSAERSHLRTLVQTIPDMVWLRDLNGVFLSCNPATARFLGLPAEQVVGQPDSLLVGPQQAAQHHASDMIAAQGDGIHRYETWLTLRENGYRGLFEVMKAPMKGSDGQLIGVLGVARDITEHRRALDEARAAKNKLRAALDAIPDLMFEVGLDGTLHDYHTPQSELLVLPPSQFLGKRLDQVLPAEVAKIQMAAIAQASQTGYSSGHQYSLELAQGLRWFELSVAHKPDDADPLPRFIAMVRDITERKRDEVQLQLDATVFEEGGEAILITDAQNRIVRINRVFVEITGYDEAQALGRNPRLLASGRHDHEFFKALWSQLEREGRWQGEIWNRRKDGALFPCWQSISRVQEGDGSTSHYVAIFSDMSQRKQAEAHILHLAHFDALTGLPNRTLLGDRAAHALGRAKRNGEMVALMFVDLDRFKNVNDSLGHHFGDELLLQLAQRFLQAVREEDTVARLGGDEFVLLLPGTSVEGAALVANKILQAAARPCQIADHEVSISCSIGVALFPQDAPDFETLSKRADIAMYRAKQAGRNAYCFFTHEMQAL